MNIIATIAQEMSLPPQRVAAVVELLDVGATIPFIARYRKERTGSMDAQVLRALAERLDRLRALDKRRTEILRLIDAQDALTPELAEKIDMADTLTALEDLYRPYRQKRRTRASIAEARGLAPLADMLLLQKPFSGTIEQQAQQFVSTENEVPDAEAALQGARDIVAERMSDDADCRGQLRERYARTGRICTAAVSDAPEAELARAALANCAEFIRSIPDHRVLAINRGEREGGLKVRLEADAPTMIDILRRVFIRRGSPTQAQLELAAEDAWNRLIAPSLERELRAALTERASRAAIEIFGRNLHQLLMQPPVKGHVTLGVDPGYRTGCKLAVVDAGGKVLETGVAHFTIPGMDRRREEAKGIVGGMIRRHGVTAIAIGNGTASREAEAFIAELIASLPDNIRYAIVSEAGASVYSASKLGAEEFPDFDVSLRSAVSIARRLQDPLAELVKIDPRSIGVGQYQHDLKEAELSRKLDGVVEDCVNAVGVELSTASAALLSHVAGIGPALAKNIVAYREENGFHSRNELKKVPKLGPKAFAQAAGFLRLADSRDVLDATAVHPESYPAAKGLLERLGYRLEDARGGAPAALRERAAAIGIPDLAASLGIGEPTLCDIIDELIKPGRDPREELPPVVLRSDVLDMDDLKPGMKLRGTVRNVTDFGAFVDIGVHQDGLVHISKLARRFVRHPSDVVKVGDVVDVWILDVDKKKKRIALSMIEPG